MTPDLVELDHQSRPLRIAIVTQGYQSAGGIQTVARWIHRELVRAGHDVKIFDLAASRSDVHSRLLARPVTWRRRSLVSRDADEPAVTHVGANGAELEVFRYLPRRELNRALSHCDLIQVVAGGPALAFAATGAGVPVALQVATTARWERDATPVHRPRGERALRNIMTHAVTALERAALRRSPVVFVENQLMQSHVARMAPHSEVVLAPPGVDTQRFTPSDAGWSDTGYLLSVCRFGDPRKGLERLISAYSLLRSDGHDIPDLVLAGRNQLPIALTQQIRDLGLIDHVRVVQDVPASDLPELYRGASVFVQTSLEEGLGMSVIEAMACGLPVVATATAGTLETMLPHVTGLMVPQDGPVAENVADAVRRIRAGGAEEMAVAARRRAEAVFSSSATAGQFLSAYARVLHRRAFADHPGTSPTDFPLSRGTS